MGALESPLNDIAASLIFLMIIIFIFMGITAILLRLLAKAIPIHKELSNLLLGMSGLLGMYVWFQISF